MIRINKINIDKFRSYNNYYSYYIKNGLYLIFNKETLELEESLSYIKGFKGYEKEINNIIEKLIYLDILEVI